MATCAAILHNIDFGNTLLSFKTTVEDLDVNQEALEDFMIAADPFIRSISLLNMVESVYLTLSNDKFSLHGNAYDLVIRHISISINSINTLLYVAGRVED